MSLGVVVKTGTPCSEALALNVAVLVQLLALDTYQMSHLHFSTPFSAGHKNLLFKANNNKWGEALQDLAHLHCGF